MPETFAEFIATTKADHSRLTTDMRKGEEIVARSANRMQDSLNRVSVASGTAATQTLKLNAVMGRVQTTAGATAALFGGLVSQLVGLGFAVSLLAAALLPIAGIFAVIGVAVGGFTALVLNLTNALELFTGAAADGKTTSVAFFQTFTDWWEGVSKAEQATEKLNEKLRQQRREMDQVRTAANRAVTAQRTLLKLERDFVEGRITEFRFRVEKGVLGGADRSEVEATVTEELRLAAAKETQARHAEQAREARQKELELQREQLQLAEELRQKEEARVRQQYASQQARAESLAQQLLVQSGVSRATFASSIAEAKLLRLQEETQALLAGREGQTPSGGITSLGGASSLRFATPATVGRVVEGPNRDIETVADNTSEILRLLRDRVQKIAAEEGLNVGSAGGLGP